MTALATTTLHEAARAHWDAIVIGAGPAGALAAQGLARLQLKTLLVDRKTFPRNKVCGSCISLRALSVLEKAGLGSRIDLLQGVPLTRVEVFLKTRSLRMALPGGVAISRADLDEMLVEAAISEGVQFLPHVQALVAPRNSTEKSAARLVELTCPNGGSISVETSAIIAADGLGHPSLRGCLEFTDRVPRNSRMGLGTTLTTTSSGFDFGCVTMAVGRLGYVGAVRLRGGPLHLAASVNQGTLRSGEPPSGLVSRILNESNLPTIPELREADWQGTIPFTRRCSTVAGHRIFLIGDAAGYVEPFTGEGIAWALATGRAVPTFVNQAVHHSSEQAEHDWQSCHRQLIRSRQAWCRRLAWVLRRPRLASAAVRLMSHMPTVPQFVINKLNQPHPSTKGDFA